MAKGEVGDGHVVHDEVELLGPVRELVADAGADRLTLAEEFLRVVLRHHGLQHLRITTVPSKGCFAMNYQYALCLPATPLSLSCLIPLTDLLPFCLLFEFYIEFYIKMNHKTRFCSSRI